MPSAHHGGRPGQRLPLEGVDVRTVMRFPLQDELGGARFA